jgi:hypothetical protein
MLQYFAPQFQLHRQGKNPATVLPGRYDMNLIFHNTTADSS